MTGRTVSKSLASTIDTLGIRITREMIIAGVRAFEEWDHFARAPFEGEGISERESTRLSHDAMIMEVLTAALRRAVPPDCDG
jgi:hypothetical protein